MPRFQACYFQSEQADEKPRTTETFDAKNLKTALEKAGERLIEADKRVTVDELPGSFVLGKSKLDGPDKVS